MADAVTVTLGGVGDKARAWVAEGRYASMSEVMREGIKALDRQEDLLDAIFNAKLAEALADDRPGTPIDEAFATIRAALRRQQ
jgi:antitoxin ParD1/3/4